MDQTLQVGDVYEEKGATIPEGWVLFISGFVDTSTVGVYEITYYARNPETGENVTRVKTVEVLAKPVGSITLNGDSVVSLALGDVSTYIDAGATSSDGTVFVTNLDGTSSESFTGLPNVAGSYTLIYYVSGAVSNFVTRTIHVVGPNSGGGGGGESAPTSGPKNIAVEKDAPIPAKSFPIQGISTDSYTPPPPNIPAKSFPIQGISTDGPPTSGPENIAVEKYAPIPAKSFPIQGISTDGSPTSGPENIAVERYTPIPAKSFPIQGISTDSTDPAPTIPNSSYPIVGTQT